MVKLIDDFSNPSREVAAQARDLEKRFNNVADVFNHAGEAFSTAGETLTKSVTAPLTAVGTAAVNSPLIHRMPSSSLQRQPEQQQKRWVNTRT